MKTKHLHSILATILLPLGSAFGHESGATTWTGVNSSDWADEDNWTTVTAPVTGEAPTGRGIRINVGASGNLTPPELIYAAAQDHTIYNISNNRALVIGNGSGTNGTVTFTGGIFDSQGRDADAIANGGGSGTINISGGQYTNVNDGSSLFTLGLNFGGTATLNVNEGSFTTGTLQVGEGAASGGTVNGIVNLNGGVLEVANFARRATAANSTINFNGGTLRASDDNASYMGTADVNTARVQADGAIIDTNGLAFLLGAPSPDVSALGLLPVPTADNGALVLTFQMRNADARGSAVLKLQHSSDLDDSWATVAIPDTSGGPTSGVTFAINPGTPLNSVTATIASSEAANGRLFARLEGEKP